MENISGWICGDLDCESADYCSTCCWWCGGTHPYEYCEAIVLFIKYCTHDCFLPVDNPYCKYGVDCLAWLSCACKPNTCTINYSWKRPCLFQ